MPVTLSEAEGFCLLGIRLGDASLSTVGLSPESHVILNIEASSRLEETIPNSY